MMPIIAPSPSQKVAAKATFRHSVSLPSDSQAGADNWATTWATTGLWQGQTTGRPATQPSLFNIKV